MLSIFPWWGFHWGLFDSCRVFTHLWGCAQYRAASCRFINDVVCYARYWNGVVLWLMHYDGKVCFMYCSSLSTTSPFWGHTRRQSPGPSSILSSNSFRQSSGDMGSSSHRKQPCCSSLWIYHLRLVSLTKDSPPNNTFSVLLWCDNAPVLLLTTNVPLMLQLSTPHEVLKQLPRVLCVFCYY